MLFVYLHDVSSGEPPQAPHEPEHVEELPSKCGLGALHDRSYRCQVYQLKYVMKIMQIGESCCALQRSCCLTLPLTSLDLAAWVLIDLHPSKALEKESMLTLVFRMVFVLFL